MTTEASLNPHKIDMSFQVVLLQDLLIIAN